MPNEPGVPNNVAPPDLRPEAVPTLPPGFAPPMPSPSPPPRETFRQGFARGSGGETYVVDAQGNVADARTTRPSWKGTFGSILAGAMMGALAGAAADRPGPGGGGVGAGAGAAREYLEKRDLTRRGQAQQNFENQERVKETTNRDLQYKADIHVKNLQAIKLAHEIDAAKVDEPLRHQELVNATLVSTLALEAAAKNLGLRNERVYKDYVSVPKADIDRFNQHAVKVVPLPDGTVKVWDRTFDARTTPNAEDFEIKELTGLDPKGKPAWKIVAHVKAGAGTAAQLEAELDKQRAQLQSAANSNAAIAKEQAQTAEAWSRVGVNKQMTQNMRNLGVNLPENFTLPPNVLTLSSANLRQELVQRGATVPGNFEALYAVGHYKADLGTFVKQQRVRGGAAMDQQTALAYIRTFVNPNFDQNNFTAVKKLEIEFASTKPGTAGGNLISFNAATGHLGQLYAAARALQNDDARGLNVIANAVKTQTGKDVGPSFEAIKGVLVGELGRLMKQAAPDVQEMREISAALTQANSPAQFVGVTRQYAHAMLTKGIEQVNHYYAYTGELPPGAFSPQAREVFAQMGINVNEFLPGGKPKETPPGAVGIAPGSDGKRYYHDAQGKNLGEAP